MGDAERDAQGFITSPIYCEHANECPVICPCPPDCYCKIRSCKSRATIDGFQKDGRTRIPMVEHQEIKSQELKGQEPRKILSVKIRLAIAIVMVLAFPYGIMLFHKSILDFSTYLFDNAATHNVEFTGFVAFISLFVLNITVVVYLFHEELFPNG